MDNYANKRISDDFHPSFPSRDAICKNCMYREKDLIEDGEVVGPGFWSGLCHKYKNEGFVIPDDILYNHAKCRYYRKELEH